MNLQNNEDSFNFSVIDRPQDAQARLDFSLHELLDQQPAHQRVDKVEPTSLQKPVEQVFSKIRKIQPQCRSILSKQKEQALSNEREGNTFLQALERMEKELSFQTESYNIYEQNGIFEPEAIQNNKSKTLSCLKTTTNKSTNPSANEQSNAFNDYCGPLIIDFKSSKDFNTKEFNTKGFKGMEKSEIEKSNKHKVEKVNKSDSKSGGRISIELSQRVNVKERMNSKSRSKEMQSTLRLREKSKSSKYLLPCDFRKSKKKDKLGQRNISKSNSNLKISSQTDAYASKVFSEYYGTDNNFNNGMPELRDKKPVFNTIKIKSRDKSNSKLKLNLLSPRGKIAQTHVRRQKN